MSSQWILLILHCLWFKPSLLCLQNPYSSIFLLLLGSGDKDYKTWIPCSLGAYNKVVDPDKPIDEKIESLIYYNLVVKRKEMPGGIA